jgi:uncharacterized glyoxalase superfamily protein PhnB
MVYGHSIVRLQGNEQMSRTDSHAPPGWPAVIPRLAVAEPEKLVNFMRQVFGAEGIYNEERPSEMKIGESIVLVGGTLQREPTASFLYVYVLDVDASYRNALSLGASSIEEPAEMHYGDRRAMVKDPWGNYWQVATHRGFDGSA